MEKWFWAMKAEKATAGNVVDAEQLPEVRNSYRKNKFEFNQKKEWYPSWCVFFAGAIAVASNYWSTDWIEWNEIAKKAHKKYWWEENQGMYVSKGTDCIVEYFNEKKENDKIEHRKIDILNEKEKFLKALDKWYMLQTWYWWSLAYNSDMLDDCVLNEEEYWKPTYYHSVNIVKNDWKVIVDNYEGRDCNRYEVKDFFERVENWTFFQNAYIYIFKKDKKMKHLNPESASTTWRKNIIVAREKEVWHDDMNFDVYNTEESSWSEEFKMDETDIIMRMLIDVYSVRK